jgi:hypothetical protein
LECLHHDYATFYNSVHGVLKPGQVLLDDENIYGCTSSCSFSQIPSTTM